MDADTITTFLVNKRDQVSEQLQLLIIDLENTWERKLWHQLTTLLIEFFSRPDSANHRLGFYMTFVLSFANKINQLKLVDLALKTASQCENDHERLTFLLTVQEKLDKEHSQDAFVYATVAVARVKLSLSDVDGARTDLDASENILDSLNSVEPAVHAAFYDANATYYQLKADHANYYRNTLLYLACIDLSTISLEERHQRAISLSNAALVSHGIFNFGELLLHPILSDLSQNEEDLWLRELLFVFNRGDLPAFEVLNDRVKSSDFLSDHASHLREKMHLVALTEAVFRRPPQDRTMTFGVISQETNVETGGIEHLIMKALSLGLLKGVLDQVSEIAHITWVQPKVLDSDQIFNLRKRLLNWDSSINGLGNWIEMAGRDMWAA